MAEVIATVLQSLRDDVISVCPWPLCVATVLVVGQLLYKYTTVAAKIKSKLWFDKPKPTPCCNCAGHAAQTYCVECQKSYCKFCVCLIHHPGMKTERHSIEALIEADDANRGVQALSSLLPDLLCFFIFFIFLGMCGRVSDEQILGASYCPVIQTTRQMFVRWDPSIFYYWKAHFAELCDFEDSAWRLYIDAWFRAVVTRTDSLFLIGAALIKAVLFEKYIELVLAKITGFLYALMAVGVRYIETYIPTEYLWLEPVCKNLSVAKYIKACKKLPPPTFWRRRPMQNYMELWTYAFNRFTRVFSYYRSHAQQIQVFWLRSLLYGAVAIRLACVVFGADYYIRAVLYFIGFGPLLEREQSMFLGLSGHSPTVEAHKPYFSERVATWGVMQAFSFRYVAFSNALEVASSILQGIRAALWPMAYKLFFPCIIIFGLRMFYLKTINKQNAFFARNWPRFREDMFGSCGRDNLVDWKNARFKPDGAIH